MKLPILDEQYKEKEVCDEFLGYCRKLRISPKQWRFQKNMTTDYYPAASTRNRRSLQSNNLPQSFTLTENGESVSYTAFQTLGACYSSGNLYLLKSLINSSNQSIGCAFIKNGELAFSEAQSVSMAALFSNSTEKRSLIRMGSSICVFPDGVVYDTAKNTVKKIEAEKSSQLLEIQTVIKSDSSVDYTPIDIGEAFRVCDSRIQHYIEDEATWVNQSTYVMIFAKNVSNTFDAFKEGDTVSVSYSSLVNNDIYTSPISKSGIFGEWGDKASIRIIKKGMISGDSDLGITSATDYIIASGHIHIFNSYQGSNYGSDRLKATLSGAVIKRKIPDIKFACECSNRIWACSADGHEIYASALGNPFNFYDFSGLSTDSYAVNVGTDGEFTACINFHGHPLFFKENALHVINGSYPTNGGELDGMSYSVSATTDFEGVESGSENSLSVINGLLYYKSPRGIVAFDGASTSDISDALGYEKYKNAVAGAQGGKYYVSMQGVDGSRSLFVFDTALATWCREDESNILAFIGIGSELLFINADSSKIYSVKTGNLLESDDYEAEEPFEWECETGDIGFEYPNNKYISRLQLRMKLEQGAGASISVMYDSSGVWHNKGEINSKGIKTHLIPIVPVRCDHMRFRIRGRGDAKILSFSKLLEEGGDSL